MNSTSTFAVNSISYDETLALGQKLGSKLTGGEVIELVGDLGSGKTVLVRGLAAGAKSLDKVRSPTFTLSRIYRGPKVTIHHFDFHRLDDGGIVAEALAEALGDPSAVVAVEWSAVVKNLLPRHRLQINFQTIGQSRQIEVIATGERYQKLIRGLK